MRRSKKGPNSTTRSATSRTAALSGAEARALTRGLAGELHNHGLSHPEMIEDDRQRVGREILDRGVLARADLIFEKLGRLLMVGNLGRHVLEIEFAALEFLEIH